MFCADPAFQRLMFMQLSSLALMIVQPLSLCQLEKDQGKSEMSWSSTG